MCVETNGEMAMEHSLTDAEETVNAVLEEVLDDAQHWRSLGQDEDEEVTLSAEPSEQRMQTQLQDPCKVTTDQAVTTLADGSGTNGPEAGTATTTLSHIPPVLSAMNPLFQPAQVVRPQSAQLQHTLSSMKRQLSALGNSMHQPPGLLPFPSCVLASIVSYAANVSSQLLGKSELHLDLSVHHPYGDKHGYSKLPC